MKTILLTLTALLIFMSCSNNQSKKADDNFKNISIDDTKKQNQIPAPDLKKIINALNQSGASFIFDVINKSENVTNYITIKEKSIALGVYTADLAYLAIYNKQNDLTTTLKPFSVLVEELEIPIGNANYIDRLNTNIANHDSLVSIINVAITDVNSQLNMAGRDDIALNILIGSWVEGVYLVERTIDFSVDPAPLRKIIIDNKESLKTIINLIEQNFYDGTQTALFGLLKELVVSIDKVIEQPGNIEAENELSTKIKEIRGSIV